MLFLMIQQMLAIWSLVSLPFLNPAWTSGSSPFTYCWSLAWRILSITLLACEIISFSLWFKWKYKRKKFFIENFQISANVSMGPHRRSTLLGEWSWVCEFHPWIEKAAFCLCLCAVIVCKKGHKSCPCCVPYYGSVTLDPPSPPEGIVGSSILPIWITFDLLWYQMWCGQRLDSHLALGVSFSCFPGNPSLPHEWAQSSLLEDDSSMEKNLGFPAKSQPAPGHQPTCAILDHPTPGWARDGAQMVHKWV